MGRTRDLALQEGIDRSPRELRPPKDGAAEGMAAT